MGMNLLTRCSGAIGSEALCLALEKCGVEHVFGLPGTQNIALFEALRRSSPRTVLATHELAAAFMANGYYRSSGRVGVLTTIPGPGFAYTVAGIAEAAQDSSALLYIAGRPAEQPNRRFNLQAIDQRAIMAPLVKRIIDVDRPQDISSAVREGYRETTRGEPGPVMLQVDDRILSGEASGDSDPREGDASPPLPARDVREVVRLLLASRRVVLFVGQGANDAADQVLLLAELLGAPVVTTRSARGVIPEDHPLALTFDWSDKGLGHLNSLLDESDLVLAVGCKLSHNGTYGYRLRLAKEKLVHIDAAESVLNANYPARTTVCGDARSILTALAADRQALESRDSDWSPHDLANFKMRSAERETALEPRISGVDPPDPAAFFAALRAALPADACLVTDSGFHQVLATRHFRVQRPRGLIIPSDFQSMGFGLPAAIGAKLANPKRSVVALIGDGGLAMSGMELITAVRERIALTVLVFNDGALGQIRRQQISSFGHAHATELLGPDLQLFAESMGAVYTHLDSDANKTLAAAVSSNTLQLIDITLRDPRAFVLERAKGMVRASARRALPRSALAWIKSKLRA